MVCVPSSSPVLLSLWTVSLTPGTGTGSPLPPFTSLSVTVMFGPFTTGFFSGVPVLAVGLGVGVVAAFAVTGASRIRPARIAVRSVAGRRCTRCLLSRFFGRGSFDLQ
ncbi:hypothetical protein AERO9AM_30391 [Aeromicrobium sp. 9AM]|nr:hypothetical protein AERO9AM_30391 [Aeromicrobium sp. 9AM]